MWLSIKDYWKDRKGMDYNNKIFSAYLHVDEFRWLGEMDFKLDH